MRVLEAVTCVHSDDAVEVDKLLANEGWTTLRLDGSGITDKDTLLVGIARDLPVAEDPGVGSWDALADGLWNMLFESDAEQVAIQWSAAEVLVDRDLQTFLAAVRVIDNVAREARAGSGGFPRPIPVILVLLGRSPAFPRWD